jgi:uncharacterized membrane protein YebE (DUF533 family)
MISIDKLLGQILNSSQGKTLAGGLLVGGLAGAMTGKTGKKVAGTALKLGGAAAIAGLAYKAFQTYQQNQQQIQNAGRPQGHSHRAPLSPPQSIAARADDVVDILPPSNSGYLPAPSDVAATEELSLKLIRAMIAAAHADGRIDRAESARIMGQIDGLGISSEEKSFLLTEIGQPRSALEVAQSATSHAEAEELYAISVMAIDANGSAERDYLGRLAEAMRLEPAWAESIHDRIAGQ